MLFDGENISFDASLVTYIISTNIPPITIINRIYEHPRRRGRRRKKLMDDLKDRRGYSHLKEEALDRTMWRNRLEEALDLSSDRILNE